MYDQSEGYDYVGHSIFNFHVGENQDLLFWKLASRKSRANPWGAFVNHFLLTDISDIYTEYKKMELAKMKHSLCIIHVMSQFSCKNTVFPQ